MILVSGLISIHLPILPTTPQISYESLCWDGIVDGKWTGECIEIPVEQPTINVSLWEYYKMPEGERIPLSNISKKDVISSLSYLFKTKYEQKIKHRF